MEFRTLRDYTIEDALQEFEDGFDCICGDGRIKILSYEREANNVRR